MLPKARTRILETLSICHSANCRGHDRLVEAILRLERVAFNSGAKSAIENWQILKLPCPDCQNPPSLSGDDGGVWLDCGTETLWIRCPGCGKREGPFGSPEEAHVYWKGLNSNAVSE